LIATRQHPYLDLSFARVNVIPEIRVREGFVGFKIGALLVVRICSLEQDQKFMKRFQCLYVKQGRSINNSVAYLPRQSFLLKGALTLNINLAAR
jgi:hypothetical protein